MLPGVVCDHVGSQGAPVCVVAHDAPSDLSGWQLLCHAEHSERNVRLTDLDRFFAEDPALQALRTTVPEGHMASRSAPGLPWVVVPLPAEDAAA